MSRRDLGALALLVLLTLGEWRLFERTLFVDGPDTAFVVTAVEGVRARRPVSPSWQQRLLAPTLVAAVARVTAGGDTRRALVVFTRAMVLVANLLAFALARRRGRDEATALATVALFGLARALLLFRLEYPWDELDILIFLYFGDWARRQRPLLPLWPLLVAGAFNHETILYVPLWYLLAPGRRRDFVSALLATAALVGLIVLVRAQLYLGRPALPAQLFEPSLPLVENHWHVAHNLGQWLRDDWRQGRVFIAATLTATVLVLLGRARRQLQSSAWTLVVLASIVCFGYVNETRHYLLLVAFWIAYV